MDYHVDSERLHVKNALGDSTLSAQERLLLVNSYICFSYIDSYGRHRITIIIIVVMSLFRVFFIVHSLRPMYACAYGCI